MADYGDVSGGNSDDAVRNIVTQLIGAPATATDVPAPVATMPAPEFTPSMTTMLPSSAPRAAPAASYPTIAIGDYSMPQIGDASLYAGAPLDITPKLQPAATPRAKPDDWAPPVPTMTPPPVTPVPFAPMGAMVRPAQRRPTMGTVYAVPN